MFPKKKKDWVIDIQPSTYNQKSKLTISEKQHDTKQTGMIVYTDLP